MKAIKISLLSLSIIGVSSLGACSEKKQGVSLYERITSLCCEVTQVSDDYLIKRYLGKQENIYACSITPNFYSPYYAGVTRIHIDDYVSEGYYGTWERLVIYTNDQLYDLQNAYQEQIISLDFIKTFDTFRELHSPDELKNIYEY